MSGICICIIALAVVIVGAAIIFGRSLVRSGHEKKVNHRLRVEDDEQRDMFSPEHMSMRVGQYREMQKLRKEVGAPVLDLPDDDTKAWPILPGQEH